MKNSAKVQRIKTKGRNIKSNVQVYVRSTDPNQDGLFAAELTVRYKGENILTLGSAARADKITVGQSVNELDAELARVIVRGKEMTYANIFKRIWLAIKWIG